MHSGGAAELASAIRTLAAAQPTDLDGIALAAELTELQRLANQLAAQVIRRVAVFHTRGDAAAEGMLSTAAFLTHRLRLTRADARQVVTTATTLPALPATTDAFEAGDISARHAGTICDGAERIGVEVLAAAEPILLEAAAVVDPGRLRRVVRHLRHVVDPEGEDADAAARFDKRGLYAAVTLDGMVSVDGLLDPDTGAIVLAALNSGPPPTSDDRRSPAQRRADRLGELLRAHARYGSPTAGATDSPRDAAALQLTLTADVETLRGIRGAAPALLDWIGPLDLTTSRLLACDCQVTGVVTDRTGGPLDVGWRHRTATPSQRKALALRDGHCRAPGCDRPPIWCDAHHVVGWYVGGRTDLDNLILLCRRHHRAVHQKVWTIHARGRGQFRFELNRRLPIAADPPFQRATADNSLR